MTCRDCGREFEGSRNQRLCPACSRQRAPKEPKACPGCGKTFIPRIRAQAYCSAECRERQKAADWTENQYTLHCIICGQEFKARSRNALYCSMKCRNQAAKERGAAAGPDREITELTAYLVHKYAAEGMSETEIAELLKRSAASVQEAMKRPLKPYQELCLREFLKERR